MSSEGNDADADDDAASSRARHHQQQSSQGISEGDFRQLLLDIAEWYDRLGYINMLKVLYRDYVDNTYELDRAHVVMDLLKLLIGSGNLSPTNLTILYDTVKATKQFGFKSKIKNDKSFQNVREIVISKFSRHRQKLLQLGMALTQADVQRLDVTYNMPLLKKYEDSWCLIMDLEHRMELDERDMDTFVEALQSNRLSQAVKIFLDDDEGRPRKRSKFVFPNDQGNNADDATVSSSAHHHQQQSSQDAVVRTYLLKRQQILCRNASRFTPAILNSRYQIDIAHMFTDLDLLKEHKKKQDAKPTTLEEVLRIIQSTPACKVLIEGEGGIGKTTLLRYIAYNWANKESDETFKDKIVFLVNIRDMDEGEDILDAIVKRIKLKDFNLKTNLPEDSKLIKRFIMNHDDEIVLLLDGLDELRDGNESLISLFKKEELGNSKVILTSRSEKIEFIKASSVHVKVKGFNADNIQKYIKKHFDYLEVPALGDSLIRELNLETKYFREVYSMCTNPLLLLIVCTTWKENQHLPADKTDLLKEVFRCILNQFIDKQKANQHKITNFEDTPEKFVNAMLVLGKCMFEGLKRNQLSINKTDLEGKKEAVDQALALGFVYKDAPSVETGFEEIFTAPHKLIVESLAGFYIYKRCQVDIENVSLENSGHLLRPIDDDEWKVIIDNAHLQNTREFAIGFLGAEAGKMLKHWIKCRRIHSTRHSKYRFLPYIQFVKEEHRMHVEKVLDEEIKWAWDIDSITVPLFGFSI